MATHASAEKAARQAERRRVKNSSSLAKIRTSLKSFRTAVAKKDKNIAPMFNELQRTLMKAASKNLIKQGTASRYISRLAQAMHKGA